MILASLVLTMCACLSVGFSQNKDSNTLKNNIDIDINYSSLIDEENNLIKKRITAPCRRFTSTLNTIKTSLQHYGMTDVVNDVEINKNLIGGKDCYSDGFIRN